MKNIQREDIHNISRYINLSEQGIDHILKQYVYSTKENWQKNNDPSQ